MTEETEAGPEPEPSADEGPQGSAESETKPEAAAGSKVEPEASPETKVEPEASPETKVEPEASPETKVEAQGDPPDLPPPVLGPSSRHEETPGLTPDRIRRLEEVYLEGRRLQRAPILATRLGSVALFVIILGFLGLILIELQERFSSWTAFEPHVRAQVEQLGPRFGDELKAVGAELAPVYGRLAQQRLESSLPLLQAEAAKEWDQLRVGLQGRTEGQVRDVIRRLEDRQWRRIEAAFPSLHDPTVRTAFEVRLHEELRAEAEEVLVGIHMRFNEDAEGLFKTLEGFQDPRLEAMHTDRLARHFVRLLLLLADRKLLELDEENPPLAVTVGQPPAEAGESSGSDLAGAEGPEQAEPGDSDQGEPGATESVESESGESESGEPESGEPESGATEPTPDEEGSDD